MEDEAWEGLVCSATTSLMGGFHPDEWARDLNTPLSPIQGCRGSLQAARLSIDQLSAQAIQAGKLPLELRTF
ncbi:hypothetical protein OH686_18880 [Pseudomonas sp. SO81]|nr:hypothetical protein OH686_18880 [Pseudomonas sp. SO81]